ncbi:MAG TPA: phosphoribosyltransferase family protein [Burkholderiaceae bacterium]|nr:phosphoribosyltransferase family protein [Burkholderiaceae bacterium]
MGALFSDRSEAGEQLAARIATDPQASALHEPIVYALPRGGVPVAAPVAARLQAPLELVLVRKIGAPMQPELAVGAIVDGETPTLVINREIAAASGADDEYIETVKARELREIERRRVTYVRGGAPQNPSGRDALVIDDGVATGATMIAAVRALKIRGARRVIVATPVAPPDTVARLAAEADAVICLVQPEWFPGISGFYRDFHQLDDEEVVELLEQAALRLKEQRRTSSGQE